MLLVAAGYQNVRISAANDMASEAAAAQAAVAAGGTATKEQLAAIEAWDETRSVIEPTEESTAKYNKWHQGSYVAAVTGQYAESYES